MAFTKDNPLTKSCITRRDIIAEDEVNGRWVVEHKAWPDIYPAGTIVCEPATPEDGYDVTFTASNGKRYMDTISGSRWTPREAP